MPENTLEGGFGIFRDPGWGQDRPVIVASYVEVTTCQKTQAKIVALVYARQRLKLF
jgi:hypothetical protein